MEIVGQVLLEELMDGQNNAWWMDKWVDNGQQVDKLTFG